MAAKSAVLLVTDMASLPETVVAWATKTFEDKVAGGEGLTVLANVHQAGGKLTAETATVDAIILLVETPGRHNSALLSEVARVLKPCGVFWIQEPIASRAVLERSLVLAGFVDVQAAESIDGVALSAPNSDGPLLECVAVQAKKPTWDSGLVFALKKKVTVSNEVLKGEDTAQTNGARQVVKLNFSDVTDNVVPLSKTTFKLDLSNDDDDEFVDEDNLLTEDDLKAPELPVADNCGPAKKACKNCSCGRKELEEKDEQAQLTAAQISNPKSSCGSCGLGDAFRCAGCPYRGLPTFKLGEKITLGGSMLVADA